jgi:DNA-binding CsgD family transcriptional regulator
MFDAFAAAYPARWSWPAKLLLPAVHPMTFVRAVHLGLMFPLGIASFVFLVVTLAVGGSLIWTLIGPIVLLVGLYLSRWFGDLEAWRVRHVAGIDLRRPPTGIERGQSFRQQVWTRLIDPSTWTGLVYLLFQFPIGIAAFVGLVVGGAVSGAFIAAPFIHLFVDDTELTEAVNVSIDLGFWSTNLTEPDEIAIVLVPLGILVYFVLVHAINLGTALHATWARLMLGSRAEPIALGPGGELPPLSPPDEPPPGGALDPMDDTPPVEDFVDGDPVAPALEEWPELPKPETTPLLPPGEEPATDAAASIAITEASEPVPPEPATLEPEAVPLAPPLQLPELVPDAEVSAEPSDGVVSELDAPLLVTTAAPLDSLTTREREVLTLIARGYSNAAIAETFVISEGTVKTHVKRVLAKLELRDRTQAAIYAYETNFVGGHASEPVAAAEPIAISRVR